MSENIKFLQLVPKTPDWGFDLSQQIATALTDKGNDVITIFLNGPYRKNVADRYPGKTIFPSYDHKKPWWRFKATIYLILLCNKHGFDTIISHSYKPSSLMAFVDRIIPARKLYMVNHNPGNLRRPGRRKIIKYLFSHRWRFVGVSDWVRRDFLEHAPFLEQEHFSVLYNCLDIDDVVSNQIDRNQAREKLQLDNQSFVFGNIHRLDPSKGHDYMIEAFASVSGQMPDAHLVIIGGGDRKSLLEDIARQHGAEDKVHLAGVMPGASNYTTAFDVFVSPSLHEGFGLGLLEGMAASIPTITSTGGASPEVVGDTGLQFPPGDKDKLAACMLTMYQMSDSDRKKMGQDAFSRLKDCFSKDIYHKNVVTLFNQLD